MNIVEYLMLKRFVTGNLKLVVTGLLISQASDNLTNIWVDAR